MEMLRPPRNQQLPPPPDFHGLLNFGSSDWVGTFEPLQILSLAIALLSSLCFHYLRSHTRLSQHIYIYLLAGFVVSDMLLSNFSTLWSRGSCTRLASAKINSESRCRRGLSNKSVPSLYFIKYGFKAAGGTAVAGAAQCTIYSVVCCSETIGCIQLLRFDAV